MKQWEKEATPNEILRIDDNCYISYLSKSNSMFAGTVLDMESTSETALIIINPWKCLILNGDFRNQYGELVDKGYEACYNFYQSQKDKHRSFWSED